MREPRRCRSEEEGQTLLSVLLEDPFQTPASFEKLVGDLAGAYSRRSNIQHRLAFGHNREDGRRERMRVWIGRSLLLIGVIHVVFGIVFFGDAFAPVLREGVFNTVTQAAPPDRGIAFWFFFAGFLTLVVGGLVHHVESLAIAFPGLLPWSLLALAVAGCVLMPVSGFWLLFVPVVGMFLRKRRMSASVPARAG